MVRKQLHILYILALLVLSLPVNAQTNDDVYEKAEHEFELGHFMAVDSLLSKTAQTFKGERLVNAYRLLALSSLYMDQPVKTEQYATLLLKADPFYTAYGDSPRLIDILERLKKGKTTVTTASQLAETMEEVPVPISLITEDMIEASGARTLSELLQMYVPGISVIAGIEDNIAMRGVYGMNQETILVMQNGHRLNSQSTNTMSMDYRINLDKVKQIEVLRGPASSLYGNVALTAVVNVITKTGSEIDGNKLTILGGNHETIGASYIRGMGNLKNDIVAWASFYNSKGEAITKGEHRGYVGGFNSNPTFDLGARMKWNDVTIEVSGNHAKPVSYFGLVSVPGIDYNKYQRQQGEKLGVSRTSVRADIDYTHQWGNWGLSASAFASEERQQIFNALGDSVSPILGSFLLMAMGEDASEDNVLTKGVFQTISWEDYAMGISASGSYQYKMNNGMYGSILAGIQSELLIPNYSTYKSGKDFNTIVNERPLYEFNTESTVSGFFQMKHNFTRNIIFNGGLRYDHKKRFNNRRLNTYSPRLSFVWIPVEKWSIKAAYSHAFVDAPYLYRSSSIPLFSGGSNLNPEKINAYQIGAGFNDDNIGLTGNVNVFFNQVRDLVYFSMSSSSSSSDSSNKESISNAGNIDIGGIETYLDFHSDKFMANLNVTYQYPFKVKNFSNQQNPEYDYIFGNDKKILIKESTSYIPNVPKFILNISGAYKFLDKPHFGSMRVRANMHMQSKIRYSSNKIEYAEDLITAYYTLSALYEQYGKAAYDLDIYKENSSKLINAYLNSNSTYPQKFYITAGTGLEWKSTFGITVNLNAYNILNRRYYAGGHIRDGVPQQGFSFVGKVSYAF